MKTGRTQNPSARTCAPFRGRDVIPVLFVIAMIASFTFLDIRVDLKQSLKSKQNVTKAASTDIRPSQKLPARKDWTLSRAPITCKALIKKPMPMHAACEDRDEHDRCDGGKDRMFSHDKQDWYLYTKHFVKLRRPGIYLDVATNSPVKFSNTYFMDACLGWRGLCVEANRRYHDSIREKRSCALLPTCVGDTEGQKVEFYDAHQMGGIVGTNKNEERWKAKGGRRKVVELTCTKMSTVLDKYGVTRVDYLSLDVEGHELYVLKGIDWNRTIINVMTIEAPRNTSITLEKYLKGKGYRRHVIERNDVTGKNGMLYRDVVFLHRVVTFGQPE